ncbi:T9SS type A sorting domain-containing protein [candidate division KSB1 bacterium]
MRAFRRIVLFVGVAVLFSFTVFSQVNEEKPVIKDSREALEEFLKNNDYEFRVRWDKKKDVPKSILGSKITKYSGTPENIARDFLKDEKVLLGIKNVDKDLILDKTVVTEKGGTKLTFQQYYKGIPVFNNGYLVSVDNFGAIYHVSGDYFPDIKINEKPGISLSQAENIADSDMGSANSESITDPLLGIYVSERDTENEKLYLAYKIEIFGDDIFNSWRYFIDAINGKILEKKSLTDGVSSYGDVYPVSPMYDVTPSSETIHRLVNQTPLILEGDNLIVYNYQGSEATGPPFEFDTTIVAFQETMIYWHADEFITFMGTLGLGTIDYITAYANHSSLWCHSEKTYNQIAFMSYGTGGKKCAALEGSNIVHEVMHIISDEFNSLNASTEADAMDEAYSDYYGVVWKNENGTASSVHGDYAMPDDARDLDNEAVYGSFNPTGDKYVNCLILSGALWDLRTDNDVDESEIDELVLESLGLLDSSPTFLEAMEALLAAADNLGYTAYIDDIEENFAAHEIGDMDVTISGPTTIYTDENRSWSANITDGTSPYSYQWYRKNTGTGTWSSVGTSSSYMSTSHSVDFDLKLVVTDNESDSDADSITVTVLEPPLEVEISGPTSIDLEEEGHQWTATASNGTSPYSYAWYQSDDVEGPNWTEVGTGTGATIELPEIFDEGVPEFFALRVVATDDDDSTEFSTLGITTYGGGGGGKVSVKIPTMFELEQNFPNPFNPVTTIRFKLPQSSDVVLTVYDATGREVARLVDGYVPAGHHSVLWDASNFASGMYIYRIQAGSFNAIKRMTLIK